MRDVEIQFRLFPSRRRHVRDTFSLRPTALFREDFGVVNRRLNWKILLVGSDEDLFWVTPEFIFYERIINRSIRVEKKKLIFGCGS